MTKSLAFMMLVITVWSKMMSLADKFDTSPWRHLMKINWRVGKKRIQMLTPLNAGKFEKNKL